MVSVVGSSGKTVSVQIFGAADLVRKLEATKLSVMAGLSRELGRAGQFLAAEVQESIIGNRAEPKSVKTGLLANSITVDVSQIDNGVVTVKPDKQTYPGSGGVTTEDVAGFMEYGTSTTEPRRHFANSLDRNEEEIKERIQASVGNSVNISFNH